MRQWIRKYSWTPSWTVNLKILLDIRVTVTFILTFPPSAGLSYWKIGTRQMCMKWLLIICHVNSVEQCQTVSTVSTVPTVSTGSTVSTVSKVSKMSTVSTVSTVSTMSTVSTVSTVVARCYLHLRWYFLWVLPAGGWAVGRVAEIYNFPAAIRQKIH